MSEAYSDAQLEAAVAALATPGRFEEAEALITRMAPQLQRILAQALDSGGWFAESHDCGAGPDAGARGRGGARDRDPHAARRGGEDGDDGRGRGRLGPGQGARGGLKPIE